MPLLASRPFNRMTLALSKVAALIVAVVALLALCGVFNAVTMLIIPKLQLNGDIWVRLVGFCAVSALYVLAFALLGAACAAGCHSESTALLLPVTIWLAVTFVVPIAGE